MKDEPTIILRRSRHGLEAVGQIDLEALEEIPLGQDVEVVFRKRRSGPQHRLYWKALGNVVRATGKWPTARVLHRDLKLALGYVEKRVNEFNGAVTYHADSTAFEKMDGLAFKTYMDQAMELIAKTCGIDPLEFYEKAKAA